MPMPIASARCRPTPALIDGLSWSALGIVLAFCALASLESTLAPHMGIVGSGGRDIVLAWLVRIPVFMVNGVTVLVTALVVLNAAGRAGRLKPALAVAAAVGGCAAAHGDAGHHEYRSEEPTAEPQSHRDLPSFPTRRSSDLSSAAAAATSCWPGWCASPYSW